MVVNEAEDHVARARFDEVNEAARAAVRRHRAAKGQLTRARKSGDPQKIAAAGQRERAASAEADRACGRAGRTSSPGPRKRKAALRASSASPPHPLASPQPATTPIHDPLNSGFGLTWAAPYEPEPSGRLRRKQLRRRVLDLPATRIQAVRCGQRAGGNAPAHRDQLRLDEGSAPLNVGVHKVLQAGQGEAGRAAAEAGCAEPDRGQLARVPAWVPRVRRFPLAGRWPRFAWCRARRAGRRSPRPRRASRLPLRRATTRAARRRRCRY